MNLPDIPSIIAHVDNSIAKALRGESLLTEKELAIQGFSTPTQRHLWNNLMGEFINYVEVGVYGGGSFFSAIKGNKHLTAIGIDNFSQDFHNPGIFAHLKENIAHYIGETPYSGDAHYAKFINDDFFSMDLDEVFSKGKYGEISCLYYDGEHSEEAQAKALPLMIDYMADSFAFIADDYQWPQVAAGTQKGVRDVMDKAKLMHWWVLDDGAPDGPNWHNGIFIGLFKKIKDW